MAFRILVLEDDAEARRSLCRVIRARLECEVLDRTCFRTQAEARVAVFEFIEASYNPVRRHSALGYRYPIEYEDIHQMSVEQRKP